MLGTVLGARESIMNTYTDMTPAIWEHFRLMTREKLITRICTFTNKWSRLWKWEGVLRRGSWDLAQKGPERLPCRNDPGTKI